MTTLLTDLTQASRDYLLLRLAILLGAGGFIGALLLAGTSAPLWIAVIVLLALTAFLLPHGSVSSVLLVLCVAVWLFTTPALSAPWVLLAAASLLVLHLGAALSAALPPPSVIPAAVWRRYRTRLLVIGGISTGVYLLYLFLRVGEVPGGPLPAAIAITVIAAGVLAHYLLVTRRAASRPPARR